MALASSGKTDRGAMGSSNVGFGLLAPRKSVKSSSTTGNGAKAKSNAGAMLASRMFSRGHAGKIANSVGSEGRDPNYPMNSTAHGSMKYPSSKANRKQVRAFPTDSQLTDHR